MGISDKRTAVAVTAMLLSGLPAHGAASGTQSTDPSGYATLVQLFEQWREFEHPLMQGDVADYGPTAMAAKAAALPAWQKKLAAIDTQGWPIAQLNDYKLVRAEMNGLDFNLRILRPWARDPAFYVSVWSARTDVPSREGPNVYPQIELYSYRFPLSSTAQHELIARIGAIPSLLDQARRISRAAMQGTCGYTARRSCAVKRAYSGNWRPEP